VIRWPCPSWTSHKCSGGAPCGCPSPPATKSASNARSPQDISRSSSGAPLARGLRVLGVEASLPRKGMWPTSASDWCSKRLVGPSHRPLRSAPRRTGSPVRCHRVIVLSGRNCGPGGGPRPATRYYGDRGPRMECTKHHSPGGGLRQPFARIGPWVFAHLRTAATASSSGCDAFP